MNANSPKLSQNVWLTACSAVLLLLAGCGGDADGEPDTPRIERAAATQLADASEEIARLAEEGNECDAAHKADEFLADVEAEIAAGSVPPALATELRVRAQALQAELTCEPPPQAEDEDKDKGEGKGKDKKDEEEDD